MNFKNKLELVTKYQKFKPSMFQAKREKTCALRVEMIESKLQV